MTQDDFEGVIYDYCRCILIPEEKQEPIERSKEYRRNLLSLIVLYTGVECIDLVDAFKDLDCKCEDVDDPKFVDLVSEITRRINNISVNKGTIDINHRISQYVNTSLRNEIIGNIEILFRQLKQDEDLIDKLRNEFNKYKDDARKCANQELIDENNKLKEELSLCYGGYKFDTEKELEAFKAFEKEHFHSGSKEQLSKLPYIVLSSCGFGISKIAVCRICEKTKNITDIDSW